MATVTNTGTQGSTNGTSTGDAVAAASGSDELGQLFTTLLVAQIRNQNPLEPTDPSEYVGQLTQLSQTETMQKLLAQTTASVSMLESLQVMTLGAQVGAELRVASDRVTLAGEAVRGSFTLASGSAATTLMLGAGSQRYRLELGTRRAGQVDFEIDPAKLGIPAGTYAIWVETESGEQPATDVFGALRSVRLSSSGGATLDVTNVGEVASSTVTGFNGRRN